MICQIFLPSVGCIFTFSMVCCLYFLFTENQQDLGWGGGFKRQVGGQTAVINVLTTREDINLQKTRPKNMSFSSPGWSLGSRWGSDCLLLKYILHFERISTPKGQSKFWSCEFQGWVPSVRNMRGSPIMCQDSAGCYRYSPGTKHDDLGPPEADRRVGKADEHGSHQARTSRCPRCVQPSTTWCLSKAAGQLLAFLSYRWGNWG